MLLEKEELNKNKKIWFWVSYFIALVSIIFSIGYATGRNRKLKEVKQELFIIFDHRFISSVATGVNSALEYAKPLLTEKELAYFKNGLKESNEKLKKEVIILPYATQPYNSHLAFIHELSTVIEDKLKPDEKTQNGYSSPNQEKIEKSATYQKFTAIKNIVFDLYRIRDFFLDHQQFSYIDPMVEALIELGKKQKVIGKLRVSMDVPSYDEKQSLIEGLNGLIEKEKRKLMLKKAI